MKWKHYNLKQKLREEVSDTLGCSYCSETAVRYCNAGWLRWGWHAHKALRDLSPGFPSGVSVKSFLIVRLEQPERVSITADETDENNSQSGHWGLIFFSLFFLKGLPRVSWVPLYFRVKWHSSSLFMEEERQKPWESGPGHLSSSLGTRPSSALHCLTWRWQSFPKRLPKIPGIWRTQ